MTETEKAYIAGIIDGEGSIMLTKFHSTQYPSPCVSIASTDIELLEWIKKTTGKGKILKKKNYNKDKHEDSYSYRIIYNDAIEFLRDIEPYLVIHQKKLRQNL
ncbi:LAGLIDADG family homing endonuclease [Caloranaerobacter ferrireducens]|uniref:LAGLIDADG family homing endonuclease n=1 Tax=Caloranaerobacter ferrireducens TaxID=1323370 RepID=UPI001FA6D2D6|nr:LAGLIDADG family homing endonuclease [Caloranaerobacter ferrireducens]